MSSRTLASSLRSSMLKQHGPAICQSMIVSVKPYTGFHDEMSRSAIECICAAIKPLNSIGISCLVCASRITLASFLKKIPISLFRQRCLLETPFYPLCNDVRGGLLLLIASRFPISASLSVDVLSPTCTKFHAVDLSKCPRL